MTEQSNRTRETRYFRTFTAHRHPLRPQEQIEFSEAQKLSTYYEARCDEKERLICFVKKLRVDDGSTGKWVTVFTEVYQYFDNGNLQQRNLKIPGVSDQIWEFTEHQKPWSIYFDQLCDRWFGRLRRIEQRSPARLSLLAHEQFTELETEVFEAAVGVGRDNQWAYEITLRILARARDIIEEIEPNAAPRIYALIEGQQDGLKLEGFDEPEPSLFGVVGSWLEDHSDLNGLETITLLAERDLDPMGQRWAAASNIGSITFAPLKAIDGNDLATAATLFLITAQSLDDEKVCVVNSIFRRLLQQIQNIVEMARVYEAANQGSRQPPF